MLTPIIIYTSLIFKLLAYAIVYHKIYTEQKYDLIPISALLLNFVSILIMTILSIGNLSMYSVGTVVLLIISGSMLYMAVTNL
jgi:hypothetical protein